MVFKLAQQLSGILWTTNQYVTRHLTDRRGVASLRYRTLYTPIYTLYTPTYTLYTPIYTLYKPYILPYTPYLHPYTPYILPYTPSINLIYTHIHLIYFKFSSATVWNFWNCFVSVIVQQKEDRFLIIVAFKWRHKLLRSAAYSKLSNIQVQNIFTTPRTRICHFRLPKTLTFKTRRSAKPFLWK